MNREKIYLIDYNRDINLVTWEYQNLSDIDRIQISNLDFKSITNFTTVCGYYCMLIITETSEFQKLKAILSNNYIHFFHKDLTKKILENRITLEQITKNSKIENQDLFETFKEKLDEWIGENLDLDTILDIINEFGIEKLRDIDRKFLKNYG
jgi:hypothetical protein